MQKRRINPLFLMIAIALVLISLAYCSYRSSTEVSDPKASTALKTQNIESQSPIRVSPADKIDLKAYAEYKKEGFPRLYDEVGQSGLDILFKHDMDSAYKVAERDDCDRVMYSAYSKEMSNYPNKIVSFVDCKNGNRFYVSNGSVDKR